jgi:hypothetical protein
LSFLGSHSKKQRHQSKVDTRTNGRRSTRDTKKRKGITRLIERNRSQYLDSAQAKIETETAYVQQAEDRNYRYVYMWPRQNDSIPYATDVSNV